MANTPAPPVDEEQVLQAITEGAGNQETIEDIYTLTETERDDPKDRGTVTHSTPGKVRVFKPMADGSYAPKDIPRQNLGFVLREGWKAKCPACKRAECTGRPNECPARESVGFRRCPLEVCGKAIFDNPVALAQAQRKTTDPNEIVDDAYVKATPAQRTRALLDRHILAYHPSEAAFLGVAVTNPRGELGVERIPNG